LGPLAPPPPPPPQPIMRVSNREKISTNESEVMPDSLRMAAVPNTMEKGFVLEAATVTNSRWHNVSVIKQN